MPQKPPLIADIRFTNQQVEQATLAGVDTTAWKVNDEVQQNRPNSLDQPPSGSRLFVDNWPNPDIFPG